MTFKKKNKKWYYILDGKEYEINASMKKDIESQKFFIKETRREYINVDFSYKEIDKKTAAELFHDCRGVELDNYLKINNWSNPKFYLELEHFKGWDDYDCDYYTNLVIEENLSAEQIKEQTKKLQDDTFKILLKRKEELEKYEKQKEKSRKKREENQLKKLLEKYPDKAKEILNS